MTTYIVGPTGAGSQDGSDWDNRLAGLNAAEDVPVVAGDVVKVGPGVYREQLTCDVSGGNTYSTGTVSVTKGSDQVTGSGTTFGGNVAADYYFHVRYYDNGADGVTDGTATFTASGGNFHANLIGCPIQINTKGAYVISAVASATSITLADPNALGWPTAGSTLTYSVMSGEGHYQIESQDDNTTLTLKQPWQGKTHSGLSYLTFNAITYIADVTGENTDDVGGAVRITGSDNDQTATRGNAILINGDDYRVFRGFTVDGSTTDVIKLSTGALYCLLEDIIVGSNSGDNAVYSVDANTGLTIRRLISLLNKDTVLSISSGGDDQGVVIENSIIRPVPYGAAVEVIGGSGGIVVRNCLLLGTWDGIKTSALTTGQVVFVANCAFAAGFKGVSANVTGEIIENFNNFSPAVDTARTNTGTGANSTAYLTLLDMPLLHAGTDQLGGYKFPWLFGELSEWSQIAAIAGVDERNTDLLGITRPATAAKNSWGPVQFHDVERETTTTRGGSVASITLHDAGVHQIWIPVTDSSTTISVYVYREANYAGTNPRMVVKQPGQADDVTTDVLAASQWNELTTTLTPAADPPYVVVELQSLNTDVANPATNDVFFDDLTVT